MKLRQRSQSDQESPASTLEPQTTIQKTLPPSVLGSNSHPLVEIISSSVTLDGTDLIPVKVIAEFKGDTKYVVEKRLASTEGFWWWAKRSYYVDKSRLLAIELDSTFQAGQTLSGCLLGYILDDIENEDNALYVLRAHVPGPFPDITLAEGFKGVFIINNQNEAIVWILAHELCHYMKRSNQLPGPNDEVSACEFANDWLETYRKDRRSRRGR